MIHKLSWKDRLAFARLAAKGYPPIRGGSEFQTAQFPVAVLQVLGMTGSFAVSHDTSLTGAGTAASPLSVAGGGSGGQAPTSYTGPTLRKGTNSVLPLVMQSTGGVVAIPSTMMTPGDLMLFFVLSDNGLTVVNAAATKLNDKSYSNGQTNTWSQVWNGSDTTTTFTNPGHNVWATMGVVVAAGSRGSPALVDQHGLDSGTGVQNWRYTSNPILTPTQNMSLFLWFTVQVAAASACANNSIMPSCGPFAGDVNNPWNVFPVSLNVPLVSGGAGIFACYRLAKEADPGIIFSYLGANGGAGNQEVGVMNVY